MASIDETLRGASERLGAAGVDAPRLSARMIAQHALGLTHAQLLARGGREVDAKAAAGIEALLARRERGEPVAYLLGEKEFYGRSFAVTPDVLVPRPETELLVEAAVAAAQEAGGAVRFADLGAGSGAIGVTLALELPGALGLAVEKSPGALAVCAANAAALGANGRLGLVLADFAAVPAAGGSLDMVVSNPPYVSRAEYEALDPEVAAFEPRAALVPGESGLEAVEAVAAEAGRLLAPGGLLLVEIGWLQGPAVRAILEGQPWSAACEIRPDLAGLDRVAAARKRN